MIAAGRRSNVWLIASAIRSGSAVSVLNV